MIYLLLFSIVGVLIFISERQNTRIISIRGIYKKKHAYINSRPAAAMIGIFLLSLIAGLRERHIGIDVMTYVFPVFSRASNETSIFTVLNNSKIEVGYELIAFLSSRIINDIHFFHFVSAFIICSGIYIFLNEFKSKISLALGMLVFMFLSYNSALNMVRQSIAIAVSVISYKYLFKKNYLKCFFIIFVATLIHNSAYIVYIIIMIYYILRNENHQSIKMIFIVIASFFFLFFIKDFVIIFSNFGILMSKYQNYFLGVGNSTIFMQLVSRLPILLLGLIYYKELCIWDKRFVFIYSMMIIDCLLGCMAPIIGDASRISGYFGIWQCVMIPGICKVLKQSVNGFKKHLISLGVMFYLIAYWTYCIVIRNFGYTYPYISDLL
jgi:hypothetical protein